jgi:hypothetical protein
MATSYGALCRDFYVNQKLALKMDLPYGRETILHLFDQVRKGVPTMRHFRRLNAEFLLESSRRELEYQWLGLRQQCIATGHVNPDSMTAALDFHRMILEQTPYHLTISPIDIDYVELMFGFDLECESNHDAIVFDALFADSPVGALLEGLPSTQVLDVQPVWGTQLTGDGETQAYFEVKTRQKSRRGKSGRYKHEPISILLTLRSYAEIDQIDDLPRILTTMADKAEALATDRLVPNLLMPIARQITSNNA